MSAAKSIDFSDWLQINLVNGLNIFRGSSWKLSDYVYYSIAFSKQAKVLLTHIFTSFTIRKKNVYFASIYCHKCKSVFSNKDDKNTRFSLLNLVFLSLETLKDFSCSVWIMSNASLIFPNYFQNSFFVGTNFHE